MFTFDTDALAAQMASSVGDWAGKFVAELVERVNAQLEDDPSQPARDGTGRARDYKTTPGRIRQSHAPWMRAIRDAFIDDLRAARRDPHDLTARFRVLASAALYAAAGSEFADIVVSGDAVPGADPLDRPAYHADARSRSRGLRAAHLSPAQQEAVLDAASADPDRVVRARQSLKRMIAEGNDSEAQIAAALLGQIGDPLNRHKLNRLAEQIDRHRWNASASVSASLPPAGASRPTHPAAPSATWPERPTSPAMSSVVSSGGEDARRVNPRSETFALNDPRTIYGDD